MPENRFVGDVARTYDRTVAPMFAPEVLEPAVDCLTSLAGGGRVLEFAIGTGRVALPLAARGIDVSGIELSADMLAELRRAPGGESIRAMEGDMATTRVDGGFSLVYLVFNTITNLTTQDEQVACFENAARHLAPPARLSGGADRREGMEWYAGYGQRHDATDGAEGRLVSMFTFTESWDSWEVHPHRRRDHRRLHHRRHGHAATPAMIP